VPPSNTWVSGAHRSLHETPLIASQLVQPFCTAYDCVQHTCHATRENWLKNKMWQHHLNYSMLFITPIPELRDWEKRRNNIIIYRLPGSNTHSVPVGHICAIAVCEWYGMLLESFFKVKYRRMRQCSCIKICKKNESSQHLCQYISCILCRHLCQEEKSEFRPDRFRRLQVGLQVADLVHISHISAGFAGLTIEVGHWLGLYVEVWPNAACSGFSCSLPSPRYVYVH